MPAHSENAPVNTHTAESQGVAASNLLPVQRRATVVYDRRSPGFPTG